MRDIQNSIDKRNAAVMELERKYRIAVKALRSYRDAQRGGDWAEAIKFGDQTLKTLGEDK